METGTIIKGLIVLSVLVLVVVFGGPLVINHLLGQQVAETQQALQEQQECTSIEARVFFSGGDVFIENGPSSSVKGSLTLYSDGVQLDQRDVEIERGGTYSGDAGQASRAVFVPEGCPDMVFSSDQ